MDARSGTSGGPEPTPVCAVGASAGGIAALRAFFRAIPADLGLAYVVIIHLAPDHPSVLAEILRQSTEMPVQQVTDGPRLKANCVYVIAPDRELIITGDEVQARPFSEPRGQRAPIDLLFRSVAAARGDGVAVIMTGAGSDGAAGVRAVREAGGLVFVQDPAEAEYPMMPRSAIATGAADFVGPLSELVQRICEVVPRKSHLRNLDEEEASRDINQILGFLRSRTGHDFSRYKRATVLRRVARRMQLTRSTTLADYAEYVRTTPEEAQNLLGDLLISVTMFFRDPASFDTLAHQGIRPLFDGAGEEGVRAWVAGCASGEEAYSVAILLLEEAERRGFKAPIQVFATDLDEGALATARLGRYPAAIEADVTEERLRRFFEREGAHYRVKQEVRDVLLFATHSMLKDPPFTRLDLVTCRNLLIYLERDVQQQVLSLFHYSLKPNGVLFLGSAETIDSTPNLFRTVDRGARLYQTQPAASPGGAVMLMPPLGAARRAVPAAPLNTPRRIHETDVAAHLRAVEAHAPPSAMVDREFRVEHLSSNVGRFISPSGGPMSTALPSIVRPELRADLTVALHRALDGRKATLTSPQAVAFDGAHRWVTLNVVPVPGEEKGPVSRAIVFFLDGGPLGIAEAPGGQDSGSSEFRFLEEELRSSEERLAFSRGNHEIAIQELRAANEELQSMNEEYRSTSEELETSKEELQSINEELHTVNAELKLKLENIALAHGDLQNLVASTDIGTLFLDAQLRIRIFTPRITALFSITEADVGRAITDFTHQLRYEGFEADAHRAIDGLAPVEKEVETKDGRWAIMRLRPYKTVENRITGVVVTFVDVSDLRTATEEIRRSEERYRALFDSMGEGLLLAEPVLNTAGAPADVAYTAANPAAIRMVKADFSGRRLTEVSREFDPAWWEMPARVLATGEAERHELYAAPLGQWFETFTWKPPGQDRHVAILFRDTTERRAAEEELRNTRDLLRLATEASRLGWGLTDLKTGTMAWDARGREILELDEGETGIANWLGRIRTDDRQRVEQQLEESIAACRPYDVEYSIVRRDGLLVHVHATGAFEVDANGVPTRGTGLVRDVTEQKIAEEAQRLLVGELNHRVKNTLAVVQSAARQTERSSTSAKEFVAAFELRLQAISTAHALLTRRNWQRAFLGELAREILFGFGGKYEQNVGIEGPPVEMDPNAAVFLTMALNELATNAIKYGALSVPAGRVRLGWVAEPSGETLRLVWEEEGGPEVAEPTRRGFGVALIEGGTLHHLDGIVTLDFRPTGLVCTMLIPFGAAVHLV